MTGKVPGVGGGACACAGCGVEQGQGLVEPLAEEGLAGLPGVVGQAGLGGPRGRGVAPVVAVVVQGEPAGDPVEVVGRVVGVVAGRVEGLVVGRRGSHGWGRQG
jgi:hypothetical protein